MKKVAVLGLGKVGALASELLHGSGFEVVGFDMNPSAGPFPFPV